MIRYIAAACLCMALLAAESFPLRGENRAIRRFTLVVGSNDGGPGRDRLRYAVSDARSFLRVLTRMGGVESADAGLLVEPDRRAFLRGVADLKDRVAAARGEARRVEVLFYYSGHSDEEGLLLGKDKYSYKELRKDIEGLPADVRIAILDSCSSGAFTRLKGGTMQAPFMVDTANDMKGYAFLTSSSSDEASQESDRIRGSFFTHYLLSGLLGAADMNDDRRVTLNESYQYAYHETLARTEKTYGGPQHPHYHIRMTGTGDVVITDTRRGPARLVLGKELHGRMAVRDGNGGLVAEINKLPGKTVGLALEEGPYRVINDRDDGIFEAKLVLGGRRESVLGSGGFIAVGREYATARGGGAYNVVPLSFSFVPLKRGDGKTTHEWSFSLFGDYCDRLDGMSLGLGLGMVEEDARGFMLNLIANYVGGSMNGAQFSYVMNYVAGDARYLQLSGVFNMVRGNARNAQISSVFNYTGGAFRGLQAATVFNYAREVSGMQLSLVNIAGPAKGLQLGLVDIAGNLKGTQTGLVNVAKDVDGVQLGLVNVSREMRGVPIGLINVSRNGGIDLTAWGSNLTAVNAGVRFRAGRFYTLFSAGGMNLDRNDDIDASRAAAVHAGLRFRGKLLSLIDRELVYLDADLGFVRIDNRTFFNEDGEGDQMAFQGRVMVGVDLLWRLSAFAGGGLSYLFAADGAVADGSYRPLFVAGVSLEF